MFRSGTSEFESVKNGGNLKDFRGIAAVTSGKDVNWAGEKLTPCMPRADDGTRAGGGRTVKKGLAVGTKPTSPIFAGRNGGAFVYCKVVVPSGQGQ
jgi:hypothetical protein